MLTAQRGGADVAVLDEAASFVEALRPDGTPRRGPYQIRQLLGQGGMGVVYLAQDTQLQRSVALKVVRPSLAADR